MLYTSNARRWVNHEKGKTPTEVGAFNTFIRTSWFQFVVTLYALPSIPVNYNEKTKKFVFDSTWLPGQDSNLRRGD